MDEANTDALLYLKLLSFVSAALDYATVYDFREYMKVTREKWEERQKPGEAFKHIADYLDRLADNLSYDQIDHDFFLPDTFGQYDSFNWPVKK